MGEVPNEFLPRINYYHRSGLAEELIGRHIVTFMEPSLEGPIEIPLRVLKVLDITQKTSDETIINGPTFICYGEAEGGIYAQARHYIGVELNGEYLPERETINLGFIDEIYTGEVARTLRALVRPEERDGIADFVRGFAPLASGVPALLERPLLNTSKIV